MLEKKLNICLITTGYPRDGGTDGIGAYTYNLAQGFARLGHAVFIIDQKLTEQKYLDNNITLLSLSKESVLVFLLLKISNFFGLSYLVEVLDRSFKVSSKILELDKKYSFDLIEGPEWEAPFFFLSLTKKPFVITLHTHLKKILELDKKNVSLVAKIVSFLESQTAKRAQFTLAASDVIAKDALSDLKITRKKIKIIPHPIDTHLFKPSKFKKNKRPVVLFVGRLEVKKGVLDLFESLREVKSKFPSIIYRFIGKDSQYHGSMKKFLLKKAKGLNLLDNIELLGEVNYKDLPKYYSSCDIFVSPSKYESFGMSILEALAVGKKTLTYKKVGVSELIIKNKLGSVIQNNKKRLLKEIIFLLKNSQDENKDAVKFIKNNLSSEIIAKEIISKLL